jgi:zinc protease
VRERLASGLTILAAATPSAEYVELNVRVPAGSCWDPDSLGGLAEFAARGTLHGTRTRTFEVFSEALDRLGASLSVDCGPDAALWRGSCLAGDLPEFSALVREALTGPAYDREDMEKLRAELKTRICERDQDTARLARRLALEDAYPPGHPYGRPPLGLIESLERIKAQDLISFHRERYGPQGTIVTAAGPLVPGEMSRVIAGQFAGWTCQSVAETGPSAPSKGWEAASPGCAGRAAPFPGPERRPAGIGRRVELPGKAQADLAFALPVISRSDPDFEGLYVLDLIFGSFGLGGRVAQRVREQLGLAYYCYSGVVEREGPGPWLLQAGINPANLELALEAILEELARIRREPVTGQELADAVGFARGSLTLQLESPVGLAGWLTRLEAYRLGLDYLAGYADRLGRLTPGKLQELAGRLLDDSRGAVVVVGPPAG